MLASGLVGLASFQRRRQWSRPAQQRLQQRVARYAESAPSDDLKRLGWVGGFAEIADRYDAFFVDLWGVLHDGKVAFPWALETLRRLRDMGKPVVFLSNSSRRKAVNTAALEHLGVERSLYLDMITSGEETWKALAGEAEAAASASLPRRVLEAEKIVMFGNGDDDAALLEALPGRELVDAERAGLLLARGCFSLGVSSDGTQPADWKALEETLAAAAKAQVPMLVANPDIVRPDGKDSPMPGQLARRYVQLGGPTPHFVGKPHAAVYEAAFQALQQNSAAAETVEKSKVCMVGDSVWHDVKGASNIGLDVVMLCTGIHSKALGLQQAPATPACPDFARLEAFLGAVPPDERPTFVTSAFSWQ
eukprot:CAMPEP_0178419992 /NCGR_PEP_ID=MMETSP0689_2-20121128/25900_1 /TAXON_ID=160604 /ORGANISM="Amphidinium massartii, Strain CS-259" /LENGTH=362 /DNA_ID=CAMNT_0020041455 /DNA_START=130 /DNA_END=1218 /DNA_ORIENTATION=-